MTVGKNRGDGFLQGQAGFLEDVDGVLLNVVGSGPFNLKGHGRSIRLTALLIKGHHLGGRTSLVDGKNERRQFYLKGVLNRPAGNTSLFLGFFYLNFFLRSLISLSG